MAYLSLVMCTGIPGKFHSSNVSRDNVSREIGRNHCIMFLSLYFVSDYSVSDYSVYEGRNNMIMYLTGVYMYVYIYIYIYLHTYIYIYIYIERERDRKKDR